MIEVFKTNVNDPVHAEMLLRQIHTTFPGYRANFDLGDCDKILRVHVTVGPVNAPRLISLLNDFGFRGEVLQDIVIPG